MSRVEKHSSLKPIKKDSLFDKLKNLGMLKKIIIGLIALFLIIIICFAIYAGVVISRTPEIDTKNIDNILTQSTRIYNDEGKELETIYSETNRKNLKKEDISKNLKHAIIALEDKTFEEHNGFNFVRILGAIKESVVGGNGISGTSTITQQLARNLYLQDSRYDHSMKRKISEAYYTRILEDELSKDKILTTYLNAVPFGYRCSGLEAAAQSYFSKSAKDLTLAQCAALAALPQAPSTFELVKFVKDGNPENYKDVLLKDTPGGVYILNDASKKRRHLCLDLMEEQGYITKKQCKEAKNTSLKDMLNPKYPLKDNNNTYFVDYLIKEVVDDLVKMGATKQEAWHTVYNKGLKIYSTLDSQAQAEVYKGINNPNNYPQLQFRIDMYGNIIRDNGKIALYAYNNLIDDKGNYVLAAGTYNRSPKGDLVFNKKSMVNVYDTKVEGDLVYSLELKSMYERKSGQIYSINGGFINIPSEYKKKDSDGNLVVSHKFLSKKENKKNFVIDASGNLRISSRAYTLKPSVLQPQGAITIVENNTGYIKAMQGGRGVSGRNVLNRAVEPHQPGSSIKPVAVYGPAIQQSVEEVKARKKHKFVDTRAKGIDKQGKHFYGDYLTPSSIIIDEPMHIEGKTWPKNFERSYMGPMSMRKAMAWSRNTTSVKTLIQVGTDYSMKMLEKFGYNYIDKNDQNYAALALGGMTRGVTTLESASAYSSFVNKGVRIEPTAYIRVEDGNGKTLLEKKKKKEKVMNEGAAWIMTNMLQSVPVIGEAPGVRLSNVKVGGKTGTTDNQIDVWFDGITPRYTASVWIGSDSNLPLSQHSDAASRLWGNIMRQIPSANMGTYPKMPSNVIKKGNEYFIKGTETNINLKDLLKGKYKICTASSFLPTNLCPEIEIINPWNNPDNIVRPNKYCPIHNDDIARFPIAKEFISKWKKQQEEKEAAELKEKLENEELEEGEDDSSNSENADENLTPSSK